jgi:hypothetical protein
MAPKQRVLHATPNLTAPRGRLSQPVAPIDELEGETEKRSANVRRVAIHEAGHAVAAHALGVPLGEITLEMASRATRSRMAGGRP